MVDHLFQLSYLVLPSFSLSLFEVGTNVGRWNRSIGSIEIREQSDGGIAFGSDILFLFSFVLFFVFFCFPYSEEISSVTRRRSSDSSYDDEGFDLDAPAQPWQNPVKPSKTQ